MGALIALRESVSSDSSSDEGAVLGTIPYVAYLWGYKHATFNTDNKTEKGKRLTGGAKPGKGGKELAWPGPGDRSVVL